MMQLADLDIEQKIGESSKVLKQFEDDINLKLIKMAKEANEALQIQEQEAKLKLQEMQQEINRQDSIQTYLVKQASNQDVEKDPEYIRYKKKLDNLLSEFQTISQDERQSELLSLQNTQTFQNVKTDKQVYEQLSSQAIQHNNNNNNNTQHPLSLRDRQYSFNKSIISTTQRNNYDDLQGWNANDNQKLCSVICSSNDLSQNQLQIHAGLGNKFQKTSKFSQKDKNVNQNETINEDQRQNTQTNMKLYIPFPDDQISNPEYLNYDLKTRFKMQLYRVAECLLVIIIVLIIIMIYQFYIK
ncbi:hypothetical protein ABPG74_015669 [Tetrahymena malaccensis]